MIFSPLECHGLGPNFRCQNQDGNSVPKRHPAVGNCTKVHNRMKSDSKGYVRRSFLTSVKIDKNLHRYLSQVYSLFPVELSKYRSPKHILAILLDINLF